MYQCFFVSCRPSEAAEPAADVIKQQQVQPTTYILDPAIKQALIDTNRDTGTLIGTFPITSASCHVCWVPHAVAAVFPAVLKLEESVLEFMADSSKSSLEFPPSTSNYEVRPQQHEHATLQCACAAANAAAALDQELKTEPMLCQ
jgi:hypothetical protein